MSDVQNYLLTVNNDKDKARSIAQNTARGLESKQSTLVEVVQSLREYIEDEDATIRSRTVGYLSQVIGELPPTFLPRQQIEVLCQFFCGTIEDDGAVGGLQKLQYLSRFNKEMVAMTFRALLDHFQDLQVRPQAQRFHVLQLLNSLMLNHRNALKEMGTVSLLGITDLVSGEKDPRNLMIIFSLLKVVMVEWDISDHAEVLFDSVFGYFPITFRQAPNDPFGITAQDLKTRLRECIAASGCFAPYAFIQLIDKLDSTSPNVKASTIDPRRSSSDCAQKDVLQTITACTLSYGLTTISNYSITLWDSLKYEILNVQEENVAEEALVSLQAVAIKLSRGVESTDQKTPLARYLRPITKECNEHLQEPQHKQAKPAGQILSALGIASPIAFLLIVKAVLPPMMTLYQDVDGIAKQRALLEVLVQFLDSAIAVFGTPGGPAPPTSLENPLNPFKDRLVEVTSQALMSTVAEEVSFRIVALKALLRLCMLRAFLQDNEIGMIVQYLDEIVLFEDPTGRDDLKKEAIRSLVEISKIKPNMIMDITFPAFMARLPDSSAAEDSAYLMTLEGLAQLSVERFVSDTLIRRLLNRLDVVLQSGGSPAYPQALLSTLQYVLAQRDLAQDPNLDDYNEKIVVGLTSRVALAAADKVPVTALNEDKSLEILGRLVVMIVRALDEHKQKSVALQIYSLFMQEDQFTPVPFRNSAPNLQRLTLILSTSLMAGIRPSLNLEFAEADEGSVQRLLAELVRLSLAEEVASIRQSILRQIGLLTNKYLPLKDTHLVMNILRNLLTSLTEATALSENAIRTVFWISKALVLRLSNTTEVLERLLILLSDSRCGFASARGFGLILAPDEILSKENGASIRLLTKQKVFNMCVPTIAKNFRSANTTIKPNYLIALSGVLEYMPTDVIMPEIDTLLPLLLQSLDLEDSDVKAATIETLVIVSRESPKAVEGHVGSLVSRLLKSSGISKVNTASVRHNALRCLRIFPSKVKDSTLLPYKSAVTRGLMTFLDDPKRHVRKEAVECRAAWFSMDEPQSE